MKLSALLLVLAVPAAAAPVTTQLPRTARPQHYDVSLVPDAQAGSGSALAKSILHAVPVD